MNTRQVLGWVMAGMMAGSAVAGGAEAAPALVPAPPPAVSTAVAHGVAADPVTTTAAVPDAAAAAPAVNAGSPDAAAATPDRKAVWEVLREIRAARPDLTPQQWQEWQKRTDAILKRAVREGKITQDQADRIRAHMEQRRGREPEGKPGRRHGLWRIPRPGGGSR